MSHHRLLIFKGHRDTGFSSFGYSFIFCVVVEAAGGRALACVVDIRDEKQVGEAVQKAVDKFGGKPTCCSSSLSIDLSSLTFTNLIGGG